MLYNQSVSKEHNQPMSEKRTYPARPFLGVSAIIRHQSRVLLVQRGRAPLKGVWSFPGGLVETGETLLEAAKRELHEETGIKAFLRGPEVLHEVIRHDGAGATEHHYVLHVYVGDYDTGMARPGGDAAAVRWVNHAEARSLELTDGALELIARFIAG